ncbi:hypothetical protein FB451DRAFT_1566626 [Mycena latifolia]|nr:hypothetical protein FB451DRAFT_1566626 [Mycena latifolia]
MPPGRRAASRARSPRSSSRPTRRTSAPPSCSLRACSSPPSSASTFHFLLAISAHYAHLVATITANGAARSHAPRAAAPAADVVYAPVHSPASSALERSVEVWVEADAGCSTRAWCTVSARASQAASPARQLAPSWSPPAYLRLPPSGRYPCPRPCTYSRPPPPYFLSPSHPSVIHTCPPAFIHFPTLALPLPYPSARTYFDTYRHQPVRYVD